MKKLFKILLALVIVFLIIIFVKNTFQKKPALNFKDQEKILTLNDDGINYEVKTRANSISDFMQETGLDLSEKDTLSLPPETNILPGMRIEIKRSKKITIQVDGRNINSYTLGTNVSQALRENDISLGRLDKSNPETFYPAENNQSITVTRINVEEKIVSENIDFKTTTKNDPKLGWREKKVEQAGVVGTREVKYKITYKNNREISRVVLEKKVTKDPVPEIVVQGTYVKVGKASKGQGTWYAWKGGLFAASPWLPIGSYAKVTNQDNGKSVVVQINDRGPFGPGRIIDLDKVAFQKIASLGAGIINVKVEEVLN